MQIESLWSWRQTVTPVTDASESRGGRKKTAQRNDRKSFKAAVGAGHKEVVTEASKRKEPR